MANNILIKRGTRAGLNALATSNAILTGQPYLITDEGRMAVGLTANTYQTLSKQVEGSPYSSLVFVIDGGGTAIAAGQMIDLPDIPFNCTVTGWTILANAAGSAVVTISKSNFSTYPTFTAMSGTQKPTLATSQKAQLGSLNTWSPALFSGDVVRASVDSATTVTKLQITLRVAKT